MHLRMGIGDGISAAPAEHQIHASGNDKRAGTDGLLEHPAQRNLGKARLGFWIAPADIAVNARKPDLLEVARAAVRGRIFRNPQVRSEMAARLK
jgi:hypothetical protein